MLIEQLMKKDLKKEEVQLKDLGIMGYALTALKLSGIRTADQITRFTKDELLMFNGLGKKTVKNIETQLNKSGFSLKDGHCDLTAENKLEIQEKLRQIRLENAANYYIELIYELNRKPIEELKEMKMLSVFDRRDIDTIIHEFGSQLKVKEFITFSKVNLCANKNYSSKKRTRELEVISMILNELGIEY